MKILIVEDEKKTGEYLTKGLTEAGFVVDLADNGLNGYHLAMTSDYDLLILDIMLPDVNGWDIVRMLRTAGKGMPILLLTALGTIEHRVKGLELGADDYLVKPFALDELSARLRVLTRSQFGAGDSRLVAGDLTLDTGTRRVKRGDAEIALSAREYALLEYLMHNKGIVLSREKIENHVWNFDYEGGTNVVDVYVGYLRKKMDTGFDKKLIRTVWGSGWVLRED